MRRAGHPLSSASVPESRFRLGRIHGWVKVRQKRNGAPWSCLDLTRRQITEHDMRKLTLLCTAAILASIATLPSMAQAAGCAQYDPNCQTYPMPGKDTGKDTDARA